MPIARVTAPLINLDGRPLAGFRNRLINGDFDIWQRGTTFSPTSGTYTADRWKITFNGAGATRTLSRQTHTVGQTNVPGNPQYFFRFDQSVAGTGGTANALQHAIEGVRTFSGKTVTVTFYAKFASATSIPAIEIQQVFGTGGSPSGTVGTTVASSVSIGTSWQKVQYTVAIPSITGKTLGSNGDDYLLLNIYAPNNATFTLDISHVSIVEGDATTEADPFSPRHIGQEESLCQRYLRPLALVNQDMICSMQAYLTTDAVGCVTFGGVPMRSNPTLFVSSPSHFALFAAGGADIALTALTLNFATPRMVRLTATVASGLVAGNATVLRANNASARAWLEAEL